MRTDSISQYASQAEAFSTIRRRVKQAAKASGQTIEALLYGNSWGLWGQSPCVSFCLSGRVQSHCPCTLHLVTCSQSHSLNLCVSRDCGPATCNRRLSCGVVSCRVSVPHRASTLIAQRTDIIWSESSSLQELPTWASLWGGRPEMNAWSILWYKVGLAAGDHEKPVWLFAVRLPGQRSSSFAHGAVSCVARNGLSSLLTRRCVLPFAE